MFDWAFENNESGSDEGSNTQSIAEFKKDRIRAIAREMIQNSLDAMADASKPVEVVFRLAKELEFGRGSLLETFERCRRAVEGRDEQGNELKFFENGISILESADEIESLVVEDYNTIGLAGRHLQALVKADARSHKGRPGTLGSKGTGKYAALASSALHTVLYSTMFADEPRRLTRAFQGKTMLASHCAPGPGGVTTLKHRTGYYGPEKFDALLEPVNSKSKIPESIRRAESGTNVAIVGFERKEGWERDLINCVVNNFYFAILDGRLRVKVLNAEGEAFSVEQSSLYEVMTDLAMDCDEDSSIYATRRAVQCVVTQENTKGIRAPDEIMEVEGLGRVDVWLGLDKGASRRVDVVRNPGMFICDVVREIKHLKNFPSWWEDFIAVTVFKSAHGNDLLRKMEPADHSSLNPGIIDDAEDQQKACDALSEFGWRVRRYLSNNMEEPSKISEGAVDFLAHLFPNQTVPGSGETDESDMFGPVNVSGINEPSPSLTRARFAGKGLSQHGDESDTEQSFDESGSKQRDSNATNTARRKRPAKKRIEVSDFRWRIEGPKQLRVFFTSELKTTCKLSLRFASEEPDRNDSIEVIEVRTADGKVAKDLTVQLQKGARHEFVLVIKDDPPGGRALIVEPIA